MRKKKDLFVVLLVTFLGTSNVFALDLDTPVACISQHCDSDSGCVVPAIGQGVDLVVVTPGIDQIMIETFYGDRTKEAQYDRDFKSMVFAKRGDQVEIKRGSLVQYMPAFIIDQNSLNSGTQIPVTTLEQRNENALPRKVDLGKMETGVAGNIRFDAQSDRLEVHIKATHSNGWASIADKLTCFNIKR